MAVMKTLLAETVYDVYLRVNIFSRIVLRVFAVIVLPIIKGKLIALITSPFLSNLFRWNLIMLVSAYVSTAKRLLEEPMLSKLAKWHENSSNWLYLASPMLPDESMAKTISAGSLQPVNLCKSKIRYVRIHVCLVCLKLLRLEIWLK